MVDLKNFYEKHEWAIFTVALFTSGLVWLYIMLYLASGRLI